jgi:hypothetical protein
LSVNVDKTKFMQIITSIRKRPVKTLTLKKGCFVSSWLRLLDTGRFSLRSGYLAGVTRRFSCSRAAVFLVAHCSSWLQRFGADERVF